MADDTTVAPPVMPIRIESAEGELVFSQLLQLAQTYLDPQYVPQLRAAYEFADSHHVGQLRKSGEPYIVHPLSVAHLLAEFHLDQTSLTAAILHDVVEDTHVSIREVEERFGSHVASLVDGLTKISKVEFRSSEERLAENFRKMILAMAKDIRVIIIKLADRLHNMRTLKALGAEKRERIAEETLEIYAPLASRLGIYVWKAELEDLCLKELRSSMYFALVDKVKQKRESRVKMIESFSFDLQTKLNDGHILAQVTGRAKHFYSIYKKMTDRKMEFDDIYDLFAVRVIVDTVAQCYEALGIVHTVYRPVPGRFKDYIAMPKANLYQSLHTTIIAGRGEMVEVQIRTAAMHQVAENGIAAHWAYKEKKNVAEVQSGFERFQWLKQMVSHQKELSDPNEFLEAVKVDLFDDEVYVFTPKGDVFALHRGATSLDFAFAVHSDLGLRATGTKVNGRIQPLRTRLHSGDVVEIIAGQKERATKDWLNFVTTSKARSKIRTHLRSAEREEARRLGQDVLEAALAKWGMGLEKAQRTGFFEDLSRVCPVGQFDDFILQVGYGKIDGPQIVQQLAQTRHAPSEPTGGVFTRDDIRSWERLSSRPTHAFSTQRNSTRSKMGVSGTGSGTNVVVDGIEGVLVRFAKCCEPLPGQSIVGFVSRGRGVTVHAASCSWALAIDPARRVSCRWGSTHDHSPEHQVRIKITTHDRKGILAHITKIIANMGIDIASADVQTTPDRRGSIVLKLQIDSIHQLKDLHQKIEAIEGVIHIERLTG